MLSQKLTRSIAARTAAVAVAIGASVIVNPSSVTGAGCAQTLAQSGPNQRVEGKVPENWRPGSGTIITGADANKAKAAALAKYPGGTVNRVLKLSDGAHRPHDQDPLAAPRVRQEELRGDRSHWIDAVSGDGLQG